jgi:eukaryotic-like serine/threonine-protein kinase
MDLIEGQSLQKGKYVIEKVIKRGTLGITYKARHIMLDQSVVIKTPSKNNIERFKKEVNTLAKFSHPNIVKTRDYFTENKHPYLVMDFISGENLYVFINKLTSQGQLFPEDEAIKCIHQIGDALIKVHEEGFVHRDVNPRNIIRQQNGTLILIDFGITQQIQDAEESSEEDRYSRVKEFTEEFSPYEQILGMQDDCKVTVDIYSLAATLYFIITGRTPENCRDREVLKLSLTPPINYIQSINKILNSAILKGMNLKADNRPKSLREWLEYLPSSSNSSGENYLESRRKTKNFLSRFILPYKRSKTPIYIDLISQHGIDYSQLERLLRERKWVEADQITIHLILEILDRQVEGWISLDDIKNISCSDLQTIDQLWVSYSRGRFGFSVQAQIWQSLKDNSAPTKKTWDDFAQRVGWHINILWLDLGWSLASERKLQTYISGWGKYEILDSSIRRFFLYCLLLPFLLCWISARFFIIILLNSLLFFRLKTAKGYFPSIIFPDHSIILGKGCKFANIETFIDEEKVRFRQRVATKIAASKRLEQQYNQVKLQFSEWESRAMQAEQHGDLELVAEALRRQKDCAYEAEMIKIPLDNSLKEEKLLRRSFLAFENKLFLLKNHELDWELEIISSKLKECGIK